MALQPTRYGASPLAAVLYVRPHTVTLPTRHLLASGVACLIAGGTALANETAGGVLSRLRQPGEVTCQPTLLYFCEDLHVRCSGQTSVATFEFKLRVADGARPIVLIASSAEVQQQYENANVEWDKEGTYVVLSPRASNGYVKLSADGKYVFRHYVRSAGVMSLGYCK